MSVCLFYGGVMFIFVITAVLILLCIADARQHCKQVAIMLLFSEVVSVSLL